MVGDTPRQIPPQGRGILHLDIAGHPLRIILGQAHFKERPAGVAVDHVPVQLAHEAPAVTVDFALQWAWRSFAVNIQGRIS